MGRQPLFDARWVKGESKRSGVSKYAYRGFRGTKPPFPTTPPLLEHRSRCEGVIEDVSLRGAERRSKPKDKGGIASPSARNDTSNRRGRGINPVRKSNGVRPINRLDLINRSLGGIV